MTREEAIGNAAVLRQRGHLLDGAQDDESRREQQDCLASAHYLESMVAAGQFDPVKFSLVRVRLDRGGYDRGMYYGTGLPLWRAVPDTGSRDTEEFRAVDRKAAKTALMEKYPNARFYR